MSRKGFSTLIVIPFILLLLSGVISYLYLINRPAYQPPIKSIKPTPSVPLTISPTLTTLPNYPATVYKPLSNQELEKKKNMFLSRNGPSWNVTLDSYGFVSSLSTDNPNLLQQFRTMDQELSEKDINAYRDFIIKNMDFFGIDNPSEIKLVYGYIAGSSRGLHTEQQIGGHNFVPENQYDQQSRISITYTSQQLPRFYITGHFWSQPQLPNSPLVSEEQFKDKLQGREISYQTAMYPCDPIPNGPSCSTQNPNGKIVLSPEYLKNLHGVTGPYLKKKSDGSMELRLVTVFSIYTPDQQSQEIDLFFDSITGEEFTIKYGP